MRSLPRQHLLAAALAACFGSVYLLWSPAALAQATAPASAQLFDVNLPAQPLGSALAELSRQTGIQTFAAGELVAGRAAPAVVGKLTPEQALRQLLAGSSLQASRTANGYAISQAPRADAALPAVTVVAGPDAETATTPVKGYVAKRAASATKTDSAILEVPRSVSVVARDQMQDQNVQTVEDALKYTAGVYAGMGGYDLRRPWTSIRGFTATFYRDGVKAASGDDDSGYFGWMTEPYGLERVEVLKGPSSILYGRGAPGGTINQVSKLPSAEPIRELGVSVGSYDRYQVNADFSGQLDEDGKLLYRVTGLARDSKTQTDYIGDDRLYIAPSLTWRIAPGTSLTVKAEHMRDRTAPKSFFPSGSLIAYNPNGKIPVDTFIGEPGYDHYDRDQSAASYIFKHQLNNDWSLNQNTHFGYSKISYNHIFGIGWLAADSIRRFTQENEAGFHTLTVDTNVQGRVRTGDVLHELLFGFDYQDSKMNHVQDQFLAPAINPYNPVYTGTSGFTRVSPTSLTRSESKQKGVYVQDQIRAGQWIVNAGVRHDQSDLDVKQVYGGTYSNDLDDSKTTYNAGLGYLLDDATMLYTNYATSFNPSQGRTFDLKPFKPDSGKQFEVGVKYEPVGANALFTASLFDLRRENVATEDLDHPYNSVQLGKVRARGAELEGKFSPLRQLDLIASYTYLNTKVLEDSTAANLGRSTGLPKNTLSVWANYRFDAPALQGLSVSAGVRSQDHIRIYGAPNTNYLPSKTLVDAALRYQVGKVTYALNATNLFDKISSDGQYYYQRRFVNASATYRW